MQDTSTAAEERDGGQRAGDAAQAVRCAGLKPGLDRQFECASELFGSVVAQEPTAGSEVARNGLVMLYVAAPGTGEETADRAEEPAPLTHGQEPSASRVSATTPRRRKSRSPARDPEHFQPAPPPGPRASGEGEPAVVDLTDEDASKPAFLDGQGLQRAPH